MEANMGNYLKVIALLSQEATSKLKSFG
uniref:Uncharacterized protein n=1 Tax=Tetranychus urticae TaxID=32264 RepID=T1L2J3_TETUR